MSKVVKIFDNVRTSQQKAIFSKGSCLPRPIFYAQTYNAPKRIEAPAPINRPPDMLRDTRSLSMLHLLPANTKCLMHHINIHWIILTSLKPIWVVYFSAHKMAYLYRKDPQGRITLHTTQSAYNVDLGCNKTIGTNNDWSAKPTLQTKYILGIKCWHQSVLIFIEAVLKERSLLLSVHSKKISLSKIFFEWTDYTFITSHQGASL